VAVSIRALRPDDIDVVVERRTPTLVGLAG
jgi:hypothetical protein